MKSKMLNNDSKFDKDNGYNDEILNVTKQVLKDTSEYHKTLFKNIEKNIIPIACVYPKVMNFKSQVLEKKRSNYQSWN